MNYLIYLIFTSSLALANPAQETLQHTKQNLYDINMRRIARAAEEGECEIEGYNLHEFDEVKTKIRQQGYNIFANMLSWCDIK